MLALLVGCIGFVVGCIVGTLPGNIHYRTLPIAYLVGFFSLAISYAIMSRTIDVGLFLAPLAYPCGSLLGQLLKEKK